MVMKPNREGQELLELTSMVTASGHNRNFVFEYNKYQYLPRVDTFADK